MGTASAAPQGSGLYVRGVKKPGQEVTREELLKFYEGRVAKWWIPDDVVFVDTLPHTATGKLLKIKLREDFSQYTFPAA